MIYISYLKIKNLFAKLTANLQIPIEVAQISKCYLKLCGYINACVRACVTI